jgi:uncharacterized protein (DUF488 family)
MMSNPISTIGHSTRAIDEFARLLQLNHITRLIDVRTVPGSRHNPQFNRASLEESLKGFAISYEHAKGLGGLRIAKKDSRNKGWKNDSFRGYADYMQTMEFEENLQALIKKSDKENVAIMCAEAVPWRCHRSLIADALQARGLKVLHIMDEKNTREHTLTSFAKVEKEKVTYPEINNQIEIFIEPTAQE